MTGRKQALRRRIMEAFAACGTPPLLGRDDSGVAEALAARHVVVLGDDGQVRMAHPFAAPPGGARVDAGGRTWWGNCAWDGLGIVAALGLEDATVTAQGIEAAGDAVFHVLVPARQWWDDIAYT